MRNSQAFSLVELSIVLVILGLLVGGVLSGQSLIRAAQLRSVTTEYQKFGTAYHTFRGKYFALPGDMNNATQFWGSLGGSGSDYACQTTTPSGTTTCNGNGDGFVGFTYDGCNIPGGTSSSVMIVAASESTRFWQHLSNAGLVEGTYSGFANANTNWAPTPQSSPTNMPSAKVGNGWWVPSGNPPAVCGGTTTRFNYTGSNPQLTLMGSDPVYSISPKPALIFKPEEAWNIDTKMDDAKPGTGKVTSDKTDCSTASGVAPPGDANAAYQLSTSTAVCSLTITL